MISTLKEKNLESLSKKELQQLVKKAFNIEKEFNDLMAATLRLGAILDLDKLLDHILHVISKIMNTETASLMLFEEPEKDLVFKIVLDRQGKKLINKKLKIGEGIAGMVAKTKKSMTINDVSACPYFDKSFDELSGFKTKSILGVPLIFQGKLVGVIEAVNKRGGKKFDDYDLKKCTILANIAALSIENAKLFKDAREAGNLRTINKFKSQLMSFVAHELKTPIYIIQYLSQLIKMEEALSERSHEHIDNIFNESQQLKKLAESFLSVSKIESGNISITKSVIALNRLVKRCIEKIKITHPSEYEIIFDAPPKHVFVNADREKLTEVLINLLSNAVKFSPHDGKVKIAAAEEKDDITVSITDNGIGIPKKDLSKIFDHFYRTEKSQKMDIKGTGLGLTIVKFLLEKMGGKIWCKSHIDKGTTFYFSLPKAKKIKKETANR